MIDINLIPVELRKKNSGGLGSFPFNLPQDLFLGVVAGVVLFLVAIHLVLGLVWLGKVGQGALCKAEWEKVLPDKNVLDKIGNESKDLRKKIAVINDMTVKRAILWSSKFNAMSDVLPRGLWLRKIVLDKNGIMVDGTVISKTQSEIANVGNFVSGLKKEVLFMQNFSSVEVNSIQRGKRNGIEVADFVIVAKLK